MSILCHDGHIVRNDDDCMPMIFVQVFQKVHNFKGLARILASRGFIHNNDLRAQSQNGSDRYPLPQPLREEKRVFFEVFFL